MGTMENNEHIPFQTDYVTNTDSNAKYILWKPTFYKCSEVAKVLKLYFFSVNTAFYYKKLQL